MVEVTIEGDTAVFEVQGSHKLWAFRSRIEVPIKHIQSVRADPKPAMGWLDGLKVSGTALPNHFRAGTFYVHGSWVFYDVLHAENAIVVELAAERFASLIIEVSDPAATVRLLQESLPGGSPPSD